MKKLLLALFLLTACSTIPTPVSSPSVAPSASSGACQPTDQDMYVYNPNRLQVQAACLYVSGTVDFVRIEADGDYHIGLKLDPQYANLVNSCNSTCLNGAEHGDLVIEPVCANPSVTQADAVSTCASDPDPLRNIPSVGQHVWMEGRYVLDQDHGWEELHPLYRWAIA